MSGSLPGGDVELEGLPQHHCPSLPRDASHHPGDPTHASTPPTNEVGNLEGEHNLNRQYDKGYDGVSYSGEVTGIVSVFITMVVITLIGFVVATMHGMCTSAPVCLAGTGHTPHPCHNPATTTNDLPRSRALRPLGPPVAQNYQAAR